MVLKTSVDWPSITQKYHVKLCAHTTTLHHPPFVMNEWMHESLNYSIAKTLRSTSRDPLLGSKTKQKIEVNNKHHSKHKYTTLTPWAVRNRRKLWDVIPAHAWSPSKNYTHIFSPFEIRLLHKRLIACPAPPRFVALLVMRAHVHSEVKLPFEILRTNFARILGSVVRVFFLHQNKVCHTVYLGFNEKTTWGANYRIGANSNHLLIVHK